MRDMLSADTCTHMVLVHKRLHPASNFLALKTAAKKVIKAYLQHCYWHMQVLTCAAQRYR